MIIRNILALGGIAPPSRHTSLCFNKIELDEEIKRLLTESDAYLAVEFTGYARTPKQFVRRIGTNEVISTLEEFETIFNYKKIIDETIASVNFESDAKIKALNLARILPLFKSEKIYSLPHKDKNKTFKSLKELAFIVKNVRDFGKLESCPEGEHVRSQAMLLAFDKVRELGSILNMEPEIDVSSTKRMIPKWVEERFSQETSFEKGVKSQWDYIYPRNFTAGLKLTTEEIMDTTFLIYHKKLLEKHSLKILTIRELIKNQHIPEKEWEPSEIKRINQYKWYMSATKLSATELLLDMSKGRGLVPYTNRMGSESSLISNYIEVMHTLNYKWSAVCNLQVGRPKSFWGTIYPNMNWDDLSIENNVMVKLLQENLEPAEKLVEMVDPDCRRLLAMEVSKALAEVSPKDALELDSVVNEFLGRREWTSIDVLMQGPSGSNKNMKKKRKAQAKKKEDLCKEAEAFTEKAKELINRYGTCFDAKPNEDELEKAAKLLRLQKKKKKEWKLNVKVGEDKFNHELIQSVFMNDITPWVRKLTEDDIHIEVGTETFVWLDKMPNDVTRNAATQLVINYLHLLQERGERNFENEMEGLEETDYEFVV